ncbi:MAG: sensor histidine kinase [Streptosporangiales bacterium]
MAARADRRIGRFALLGWAFGFVFTGLLGLLLFGLSVVGLILAPAVVGMHALFALVPATRGLTRWQRRWAGRALGREVVSPYLPATGRGVRGTVRGYGRDPASWRDFLWLFCSFFIGEITSGMYIGLFAGTLFYLVYPFLWWITGGVVFDHFFGFIPVHDLWVSAMLAYPTAAVVFGLWLLVGKPLMVARARVDEAFLAPTESSALKQRVQQLSASRAETVDTQAAELRRIERDLHDGAQARLVSLGMSLGLAEELAETDPEKVRALLAEARAESGAALSELRNLVRGIHPPVLADRGLDGALHALALGSPLDIDVDVDLPARPSAPVESAAYFAASEVLTNAAKHSGSSSAWLRARYADGRLSLIVGDHGCGGASFTENGGLRGIERRLSAFDGKIVVTSPPGGPTVVIMELPCELSSQRISPSSETG